MTMQNNLPEMEATSVPDPAFSPWWWHACGKAYYYNCSCCCTVLDFERHAHLLESSHILLVSIHSLASVDRWPRNGTFPLVLKVVGTPFVQTFNVAPTTYLTLSHAWDVRKATFMYTCTRGCCVHNKINSSCNVSWPVVCTHKLLRGSMEQCKNA
jgi:hypothetical protein